MAPALRAGFLVVSVTVLAACQTPFASRSDKRVEPLAAVPSGEVQQSTLPPPSDIPNDQFSAVGAMPDATNPGDAERINSIGETAVAGPAPGAGSSSILLGRTDLLGGWTVSSDGDSCQLFMSLTTWSGGYRATTRGCSTSGLQEISAWNLTGQQVQLLNSEGVQVARLFASSKTKFDGQMESGSGIGFFR